MLFFIALSKCRIFELLCHKNVFILNLNLCATLSLAHEHVFALELPSRIRRTQFHMRWMPSRILFCSPWGRWSSRWENLIFAFRTDAKLCEHTFWHLDKKLTVSSSVRKTQLWCPREKAQMKWRQLKRGWDEAIETGSEQRQIAWIVDLGLRT